MKIKERAHIEKVKSLPVSKVKKNVCYKFFLILQLEACSFEVYI